MAREPYEHRRNEDYWRHKRDGLNGYWESTRKIRELENKARRHALESERLAREIVAYLEAVRRRDAEGKPSMVVVY